ncbi:hypothetical protein NQ317_007216 [Molorchus minor]|uniref:Carboxylesterase type B domain-containing protein n=1 Tax=Molorchus minor TaxID=1323400 RepID=A0ABQ9IS69_9CUCU|nr:hypothetical protein NQ317_007216 [Molorchus minor]
MDRDLYQDFFLYIIVVSLIVPVFRGEEPIVKTYLGKIGGAWKTSYGGKRYAAFEGIPYAKPPVDMFRFEARLFNV